MKRRAFLGSGATLIAGLTTGTLSAQETYDRPLDRIRNIFNRKVIDDADNDRDLDGGWVDEPKLRDVIIKGRKFQSISELDSSIRGTGSKKVVMLNDFYRTVTGSEYLPHEQGPDDCVSHATGTAIDLLTCVQIAMRGAPHRWVGETVTEIIHGGSQREIGDRYGFRMYRGSFCVCAAAFIREYGTLYRKQYLNGEYDFTDYSYAQSQVFTQNGVPEGLEILSRAHPMGCAAVVRSWEQVRDAVANGYPVMVGSMQGFRTRGGRDTEGFLLPGTNRWAHGMCIGGVRDDNRPGGCLFNSWGTKWLSGPRVHRQPEGSFWADASVIDRMVRQGDAFALSCYAGYPQMSYDLW